MNALWKLAIPLVMALVLAMFADVSRAPPDGFGIPIVLKYPPRSLHLEAIEQWETKSLAQPGCDIGEASEFGPYQIKLTTVRDIYKWSREDVPDDEIRTILCEPERAYWVGLKVLEQCRRFGKRTPYAIFYCWNAGPRSQINSNDLVRRYAKQVSVTYADLVRQKQWERKQ